MAWTTPAIQTTGTLMTAALWNAQVTNNLAVLSSHAHTGAAGQGTALNFVPSGMIGIFDVNCPSGWTRMAAYDNRLLRGSATYDTGSTDTHTHPGNAHTHTAAGTHSVGTFGYDSFGASEAKGAGATNVSSNVHLHAVTGTSSTLINANTIVSGAADSSLPPYITVIFCKRD